MQLIADKWQDYELLDAGDGEKLERWGQFVLRRPDPQAMWPQPAHSHPSWNKPDMLYHREEGGGEWEVTKGKVRNEAKGAGIPATWQISYGKLKFTVKPTSFKHTALFPEQAVNWEFIQERIQKSQNKDFHVLNLFAYTGGASIAAAAAGASEVVHVDSSRGMNEVAEQNLEISGLGSKNVRFIAEDAISFMKREIRRGRKYHGIIMDPPPFGRGDKGQVWKLEKQLGQLIELTQQLLADDASFVIVSTYAAEVSPTTIANMLELSIVTKHGGTTQAGELGLPITSKKLVLPCGFYARWQS